MGLNQAELKIRDAMSAAKTAEDIAEELGYPIEDVWKTQQKVFRSIDGYTLDEQLKLTILDLREIGAMAKENYRIDANSRQAEAAVKAFDAAAGRIDAISKRVDDSIFKMNQEQADYLVKLVTKATYAAFKELSDRYPVLELEEAEGVFQQRLDVVTSSVKQD